MCYNCLLLPHAHIKHRKKKLCLCSSKQLSPKSRTGTIRFRIIYMAPQISFRSPLFLDKDGNIIQRMGSQGQSRKGRVILWKAAEQLVKDWWNQRKLLLVHGMKGFFGAFSLSTLLWSLMCSLSYCLRFARLSFFYYYYFTLIWTIGLIGVFDRETLLNHIFAVFLFFFFPSRTPLKFLRPFIFNSNLASGNSLTNNAV